MESPEVLRQWNVGPSKSGRGDWIRTSDPLRPRQVRYQAALRPDSRALRFYATSPAGQNVLSYPTISAAQCGDGRWHAPRFDIETRMQHKLRASRGSSGSR